MKKFMLFNVVAIFVVFAVLGLLMASFHWGWFNVVRANPVDHINIHFANGFGTVQEYETVRVPLFARDNDVPATLANHTRMPNSNLFTREGHTFRGWEDQVTGTRFAPGNEGGHIPAGLTSDDYGRIFTAVWDVQSFWLNFDTDTNFVVNPARRSVDFNEILTNLPTVTRPNYNFVGWFTERNGVGQNIGNGTQFTWARDLTIFAHWVHDGTLPSFWLHFDTTTTLVANPPSRQVQQNSALANLPVVSRANYTFSGWFSQRNGAGQGVVNGTIFTWNSDLTVFAHWVADTVTPPPALTITYHANGGTVNGVEIFVVTVPAGQAHTFLTPVRSGFTFYHWWYTETRMVSTIDELRALAANDGLTSVTIAARWTPVMDFRIQMFWNDQPNFGRDNWFLSRSMRADERPTLHDLFLTRNTQNQVINDTARFNWPGHHRLAWTRRQYTVFHDLNVALGFMEPTLDLTQMTMTQMGHHFGVQQSGNTWIIVVFAAWLRV